MWELELVGAAAWEGRELRRRIDMWDGSSSGGRVIRVVACHSLSVVACDVGRGGSNPTSLPVEFFQIRDR